ncbi:unnamed protein product [Blepharisma stoltei]|uniref:Methyltransferase domain-containing protein n=1 Tax=Blepharisma stoltei TaxID=1481888 RepID=A0AAU9JY00_9CILI|nr:unnamed protein product [Blepharisma stoltei]
MVSEGGFDANYYVVLKSDPLFYNCHEYTIIKSLSNDGSYSGTALDGMKILNLACGPATEIPHFLEKGASLVVGLDVDANMVNNAKYYLSSIGSDSSKYSIYKADCFSIDSISQALPLDIYSDYFDAVADFWLICNASSITQLESGFKATNKFLKIGGIYSFVTVNPKEIQEFSKFQELMSVDWYTNLKRLFYDGEIAKIEYAFMDMKTRQEKFVFNATVWTLDDVKNALERCGFELVGAKGYETNPNFDFSNKSQQSRELMTGEYTPGFCFKARKIANAEN